MYDAQAATKVNDLVSARRVRLSQAEDALPTVFQILLLGGSEVSISSAVFHEGALKLLGP